MIEEQFFYFISDKMFYAVLCGFLVGLERIFNDSSSKNSMKTLILVCVGSMLFASLGYSHQILEKEIARIIAQIITGIGFLGAGVILHKKDEIVSGLTTAAFIWFLAVIGVIIALGFGKLAVFITISLTIVISVINRFEQWLRDKNDE